MLAATDSLDAIRCCAALIVDVPLRVAPMWPAIRQAAAVDEEIADLLRTYDRARLEGIGEIVDVIGRLGALHRGRTRAKAKEAVFFLTDPSTAVRAEELRWSPTDLQRWYSECLSALLLR